jgi:hypothetical protein
LSGYLAVVLAAHLMERSLCCFHYPMPGKCCLLQDSARTHKTENIGLSMHGVRPSDGRASTASGIYSPLLVPDHHIHCTAHHPVKVAQLHQRTEHIRHNSRCAAAAATTYVCHSPTLIMTLAESRSRRFGRAQTVLCKVCISAIELLLQW